MTTSEYLKIDISLSKKWLAELEDAFKANDTNKMFQALGALKDSVENIDSDVTTYCHEIGRL